MQPAFSRFMGRTGLSSEYFVGEPARSTGYFSSPDRKKMNQTREAMQLMRTSTLYA